MYQRSLEKGEKKSCKKYDFHRIAFDWGKYDEYLLIVEFYLQFIINILSNEAFPTENWVSIVTFMLKFGETFVCFFL